MFPTTAAAMEQISLPYSRYNGHSRYSFEGWRLSEPRSRHTHTHTCNMVPLSLSPCAPSQHPSNSQHPGLHAPSILPYSSSTFISPTSSSSLNFGKDKPDRNAPSPQTGAWLLDNTQSHCTEQKHFASPEHRCRGTEQFLPEPTPSLQACQRTHFYKMPMQEKFIFEPRGPSR
jgi:hypothetical protein